MSKRDAIKMTDEELGAFLAAERKVQIASLGKDGAPHLVTMFYTLWDGKIAFTTYKNSQKVLNLQRNPVMTCLVEAGTDYNELRGASLTGNALVTDDPEILHPVGIVVGHQIIGMEPPKDPAEADPAIVEGILHMMRKRVVVILEPTKITSWDHAKLG
ncbi:pyridoxamine 5'-phosphate oxidase family protein [Actinocorallia populi]|uniref:pyridoxamine 5'-phosphate oxidase family protein n=1 Tax=Actinocorallia populi TaxID=2079200 RepID=UPI000D091D2A|nr:pyridoxamine 5'-phosphate oxidase family protein [Actinocorallia populi]